MTEIQSLDDLVARIPNGAKVAVVPDYSGVAITATIELIRRGAQDLHVVCVPISGLQADLLIGAGCVATIETSAVTLGEFGGAPRFNAALKNRKINVLDATCPAIHAALMASEKGVPFATLRGLVGSDVLARRSDWRMIDNPFAPNDAIVALPAIQPDIALFHAHVADRQGNVWVGRRREQIVMAHASKSALVTVEEIVDDNLLADERTAAGVLPSLYVTALAEAKRGAWPIGLWEGYPADEAFLQNYAKVARDDDGFDRALAGMLSGATRAAAE